MNPLWKASSEPCILSDCEIASLYHTEEMEIIVKSSTVGFIWYYMVCIECSIPYLSCTSLLRKLVAIVAIYAGLNAIYLALHSILMIPRLNLLVMAVVRVLSGDSKSTEDSSRLTSLCLMS